MIDKQLFVEENTRERERLRALVNRMTDKYLERRIDGDWTVAALLAHLAFWDYRALVLLNRWNRVGIGPSLIDVDGVNDAALPLCLAIPPRVAANLALAAAEAIDHALECATPEMIAQIEALGGKFRLRRWGSIAASIWSRSNAFSKKRIVRATGDGPANQGRNLN